jgi:hypothetical protein
MNASKHIASAGSNDAGHNDAGAEAQTYSKLMSLAHPVRAVASQPTLPEMLEQFFGKPVWRAMSDAFKGPRLTSEILNDCANVPGESRLRDYLLHLGYADGGTGHGNAHAMMTLLRQISNPAPYFRFEDDLVGLLKRTDISDDVPVSMLQLPFDRIYLELGTDRSRIDVVIPNIKTGNHPLEGAYLELGETEMLGKCLYITLTGSPVGREDPLDDCTYGIALRMGDPDLSLKDAIPEAFERQLAHAASHGLTVASMADLEPLKDCCRLIAKAVLYLGLPEARRTLHPERTEWNRSHSGLKSRAKVAKAQRRGALLVDHVLVSAPPLPDRDESGHCEPSGRTVRAHWRRGHYRMQAHGPHHSLRKLILLRPMLVNAEEAARSDDVRPSNYVVR